MFGAGTKHNGNGDNRFAILIQGSIGVKVNPDETFQQEQFEANIQEMGRLLTEHPGNTKPGPGYTGYYLQDHIFYIGSHYDIPEVDMDIPILTQFIYLTIEEVAKKVDSYDKVILFYTGLGDKITSGGTTEYFFDSDNSDSITASDIKPLDSTGNNDGLCHHLNTIECKDMIIILQPDYSGDWINYLAFDPTMMGIPETNRVILTSERSGNTAEFDLCNKETGVGNDKWYVDYFPTWPERERFYSSFPSPPTSWKYVVTDKSTVQDKIYEIDKENDDTFDFYENPFDFGSEFVSGLTEAYYIDRDYYYGSSSHHESNSYLDADDDDAHNDPEITQGDQNKYVSCKEAHYSMLNWNLAYRLGSGSIGSPSGPNPWYDVPQKEFTWLEEGTVYLY